MAAASVPSTVDRFALETHGDRRRRQLVRVAAHVIEEEGIDSLRMPRVAEVAGCARSLVYRYFPRREDLFFAVISEFYERLEERMRPDAQQDGMRSLAETGSARPLLEAIWDVIEETGTAGLILYASPRLSAELGAQLAPKNQRFEAGWMVPLRAAGLSELEALLVVRSAAALLAALVEPWSDGKLDRETAIELGQRGLHGLIAGFVEGHSADAVKEPA